jgi:hypothetical protein
LFAIFANCNVNQTAGTVDDTDTGISVYLPDGQPAENATVKFIPASRSQTTGMFKVLAGNAASAVVKTNRNGKFEVPSLPDSIYNVFMEKDDLKAFQGSVTIISNTTTLHDDTLRQTGSFSAYVALDPRDMHNVKSVVIQILGSDIQFLNPENNGKFKFDNIAAGTYRLRLETNIAEYSPTFYDMTVRSGIDSISSDTIHLNYTGIPSVKGLTASYDTSSGTVILNWQKTTYSNLLNYIIYRDNASAVDFSKTPYKATADTIYRDTIFREHTTDSLVNYCYRVAIRNNSTTIGSTFGSVTITAIPFRAVLPVVDTIKTIFDTLEGRVNLKWKLNMLLDSNYDYFITRIIKGYIASPVGINLTEPKIEKFDTLGHFAMSATTDSLFGKIISYKDSLLYKVNYSAAVYKKNWQLVGKSLNSDTLNIQPYRNLIPHLDSIQLDYDTIRGIMTVKQLQNITDTNLSTCTIIRSIVNAQSQKPYIDTVINWNGRVFIDTIYPKYISNENFGNTLITYQIAVNHKKWGLTGLFTSCSKSVKSYKAFVPVIDAGSNQVVVLTTDVTVKGAILSAAFPIVKREWKIGGNDWISADENGSVQFKAVNPAENDTITCIYKVTDATGNFAFDTVFIRTTPVSVTAVEGNVRFSGIGISIPTAFVYHDTMWAIGGASDGIGNEIWCSADGITWINVKKTAEFPQRDETSVIVYDNKIWVIGGAYKQNKLFNDVWYSSNGYDYLLATDSAAFSKRYRHSVVAFNNKMWLTGGTNQGNEIWSSTDGIEWTLVTDNAPFLPRGMHSSIVFKNKMWIIGGAVTKSGVGNAAGNYITDVWSSVDGSSWVKEASNPFPMEIYSPETILHNNKLWVIGGYFNTSIWYSENGIKWKSTNPISSSFDITASVVVCSFKDKIWLYDASKGSIANLNVFK